MKKLTIISVLILFTTHVMSQDRYIEWAKESSKIATQEGEPDYYGLIIKQANEEWQGDYSYTVIAGQANEKWEIDSIDYSIMIDYEIKRQCEAFYDFFHAEKPYGMPESTYEVIRAKAMAEWWEKDSNDITIKVDWALVWYEYKRQIKAYLDIFLSKKDN